MQSIKELPGSAVNVPTTSELGTAAPLSTIPGSENEFKQDQLPLARVMVIRFDAFGALLSISNYN